MLHRSTRTIAQFSCQISNTGICNTDCCQTATIQNKEHCGYISQLSINFFILYTQSVGPNQAWFMPRNINLYLHFIWFPSLSLSWRRSLKIFFVEDKGPCILHTEHYDSWWHDDERRQGISNYGIDLNGKIMDRVYGNSNLFRINMPIWTDI